MSTLSAERVAAVFVEAADTLIDEFDLIEFLHMVTTRASELVGSAAAGLLLVDAGGVLQFMAASDEQAQLLELFQVQAVEGPCQDCFRTGSPITVADLREAGDRWPRFAPRAVEAGFRSVHAFPMRLRREVIGALNLFGTLPAQMDPSDIPVVQALADVATIGVLQERAVRRGEAVSEQLQAALQSRIVIEQAKGAIAQVFGVSVDEAFKILRTYCRSNSLRLGAVALSVVTDPATLTKLRPRR